MALGPFALVSVGQATTLDFVIVDSPVEPQHYAFSVTEAEFDEIFPRIRDRALRYWGDPFRHEPDRINAWDGGRGVYFDDPNGRLLLLPFVASSATMIVVAAKVAFRRATRQEMHTTQERSPR